MPSPTSVREVFGNATLDRVSTVITPPLRFLGFWAAVILPFLYLPLLYGGLDSQRATVFVALVLANALALVVGHGYRQ